MFQQIKPDKHLLNIFIFPPKFFSVHNCLVPCLTYIYRQRSVSTCGVSSSIYMYFKVLKYFIRLHVSKMYPLVCTILYELFWSSSSKTNLRIYSLAKIKIKNEFTQIQKIHLVHLTFCHS